MKKILIALEEIRFGQPVEAKCLEIFKALQGRYEIHIYAKEISLNEVGEYMRMKGGIFHTPDPYLRDKTYDVLVALDDWGASSSSIFTATKKFRLNQESMIPELIRFIENADVKKNLTDEKSPSSSPAGEENQTSSQGDLSPSKPSRTSRSSASSTKKAKGRTGQGTKASKK